MFHYPVFAGFMIPVVVAGCCRRLHGVALARWRLRPISRLLQPVAEDVSRWSSYGHPHVTGDGRVKGEFWTTEEPAPFGSSAEAYAAVEDWESGVGLASDR